jgi:NAD(P)-dependent dehydrogenase (short-subunit alcohol dehydrogenase family)
MVVMTMQGKVAVVTGAGMGIGRAAAIRFSTAGVKVVIADIDEKQGQATVTQVRDLGGEAAFVQVDVRDEAQVSNMVDFAVETFGGLDYALNNAGGRGAGGAGAAPIHELTEDEWDQLVGLNLKGVWLCMKHEIRYMLGHGGGSIVNTASSVVYRASASKVWYGAAKHGVIGLTKGAAFEYARNGIRVNSVAPGVTATEMVVGMYGEAGAQELAERLNPIGRLVQPSELADAAVWLCSAEAGAITGVMLPVDGGQSTV